MKKMREEFLKLCQLVQSYVKSYDVALILSHYITHAHCFIIHALIP